MAVFWLFFADRIVKNTIETCGTKALGAKVDLGSADLSLFPGGLKLTRLQVTNPDEPMRNAVEIGAIALSLDTLNLLRRKVIVENMTIDGMQMDTPRKRSGAIANKKTSQTKDNARSDQAKTPCTQMRLPSFKLPDINKVLSSENLTAINAIAAFNKAMATENEKWKQIIRHLPDKDKFDDYKKRLARLKSGSGGISGLLGSAGNAARLKSEIETDMAQIRKVHTDFNGKLSQLKKSYAQIQNAPLDDFKRLRTKYGLSPDNMANAARLLFGQRICSWITKAKSWYEMINPILNRPAPGDKTPSVAKPLRGKGQIFRFKEYNPTPDFLIRNTKAGLILAMGELSGIIKNITPDQEILGFPTTFKFEGQKLKDAKRVFLDGVFDARKPTEPKTSIAMKIDRLALKDLPLSTAADLPVTLARASADINLKASLISNDIDALVKAKLAPAELKAISKADAGPIVKSMASTLSGVDGFSLKASLKGPLDGYRLSLSSDLDRQLGKTIGKALRDKTARFEKALKKGIMVKVDGPLKNADGQMSAFSSIGKQVTSRLKLGDDMLSSIKRPF
jgi:uncharacterized protein (TIGR03545 family)